MAFIVEAPPVKGGDAAGFLTAMLKGVKPQRRQDGGVVRVENSEYAALLAQPVLVRIEEGACAISGGKGQRSSSLSPSDLVVISWSRLCRWRCS